MCCSPIFEPTEEEIRDWIANGVLLEEAVPDDTGGRAGIWLAVVRDPRGFSITFRAEERLLRETFGRELSALRR